MARKAKTEDTLFIDPSAAVTTVQDKVTAIERITPEDALKPEVTTIATEAKAIVITTHAQNEAAGLFLKTVKAMRKKVAELCDPVCAAAHAAWKKTVALRDSLDAPLERAELDVKSKVRTFLDDQERLRREEEHRKNYEAMKAAQDKAEKDALLLDAIGEEDAAQAVLETPVRVAYQHIAPVAQPEGIARIANWKAKIIDESLVPREYLMLDMVKINGVVKAMKEATKIPGIEAVDVGTVRVG